MEIYYSKQVLRKLQLWLIGQAVKTPPSHGGNRGSIPLSAALCLICKQKDREAVWNSTDSKKTVWLIGQAVKTPPSHGGNRGSIPLSAVVHDNRIPTECGFYCFKRTAQPGKCRKPVFRTFFCVEKQNGRGLQAGLFPGAADDFRHFRRKRENNSAGIGSAVVDTGLDGTVAYNGPARAGGGGTVGRRPSGGNARSSANGAFP